MNRLHGPGLGLIVIGIAFVVLGASGRHAFVAIGLAFAVVGVAALARASRLR
jgi:hypothetical protein